MGAHSILNRIGVGKMRVLPSFHPHRSWKLVRVGHTSVTFDAIVGMIRSNGAFTVLRATPSPVFFLQ